MALDIPDMDFNGLGIPDMEFPEAEQQPNLLQKAGAAAQRFVIDPSEKLVQEPLASAARGIGNIPLQLGGGLYNLLQGATGGKMADIPSLTEGAQYPSIAGGTELAAGLLIPGATAPKALGVGGRIAAGGLEGALYGGLYGAAQKEPVKGAKYGALLGTAGTSAAELMPIAAQGVSKGLRKLGRRSPENVAKLRKALGGTKLDFGSLIDNPWLTDTFMKLGHMPLTNARKFLEKALNKDSTLASEAVRRMSYGENPIEIPGLISEGVRNAAENAERVKQSNYNYINEEASKQGINVNARPEIRKVAEEQLKKHNKMMSTEKKSSFDNDFLEEIEAAIQPDISPDAEPRNLDTAMLTWSRLKEASSKASKEGDKFKSGEYSKLADALDKDIANSLKANERSDLHANWQAAKEQFKNEVMPFRAKNIKDIAYQTEKYNPDKVHTVLMDGKNDKVMKMLDDKTKHLVAHQHYTSGVRGDEEGNMLLSAAFLHNKHDKFPERLKDIVFDKNDKELLDGLNAIKQIMSEYKIQMKEPGTGMRRIKHATQLGMVYQASHHPHAAAAIWAGGKGLRQILGSDTLGELYATGKLPKDYELLEESLRRAARPPYRREQE